MAREVTAARPATPKRLHRGYDPSASLTDLSRLVAKSPVPKAGPSRVPTAVRRSRPILGERHDNVVVPAPPAAAVAVKPVSLIKKSAVRVTTKPRPSLRKFSSLPHSSPTGPTAPKSIHNSRFREESSSHELRSPSLRLDENVTQLLDVQFPDMTFHAWDQDDTVEFAAPKRQSKVASSSRGLLTPDPSQELPAAAQSRPRHHSSAPSSSSSVKRNPISRLPTPPSSQDEASPESTPIATSLAKRVRPRPTATPPRPRTSAGRSSLAAAVGDVWEFDIPLRQEDEPSPNPRRKKSPRLRDHEAEHGAQSTYPEIREIILTPPARSSQMRARVKGRQSLRTPSLSLSQSNASQSSSARRAAPASEPPARKRFSIHTPRARSNTPSVQDRARRSMTPAQRKVLSGRKLGLLDKEVELTPGDDELLLLGAVSRRRRSAIATQDEAQNPVRRQRTPPSPVSPDEETPSLSRDAAPSMAMAPLDGDMSFDAIGDFSNADDWASDNDTEMNGSDVEPGPEDTFIHVNSRPLARDLSITGTLRALSPLLEHDPSRPAPSDAVVSASAEIVSEPEIRETQPAVQPHDAIDDVRRDSVPPAFSANQPRFEGPDISVESPSFDISVDPSFSSDDSNHNEVDVAKMDNEQAGDTTPSEFQEGPSHPSSEDIDQRNDEIALARLLREIEQEEDLPEVLPATSGSASPNGPWLSSPASSVAGDRTEDGISGDWDSPSILTSAKAESLEDVHEKEVTASAEGDFPMDLEDNIPLLQFEPLPSPRRTPVRIAHTAPTVNVISPVRAISPARSVFVTTAKGASFDEGVKHSPGPAILPEDVTTTATPASLPDEPVIEQTHTDTSTSGREDETALSHENIPNEADQTVIASSDAWVTPDDAVADDPIELPPNVDTVVLEPILEFEPLLSPRRRSVGLRTREQTEPIEKFGPMVDFRLRRAHSLAPINLPMLLIPDTTAPSCAVDPQTKPSSCEQISVIQSSEGEAPGAQHEDLVNPFSFGIQIDPSFEAERVIRDHSDFSLELPAAIGEDDSGPVQATNGLFREEKADSADETQDAISGEWDVSSVAFTHPVQDSALTNDLEVVSSPESGLAPTFEAFVAGVPDQSVVSLSLETPGEGVNDAEPEDTSSVANDDVRAEAENGLQEEQERAAPPSDEKLILRLVLRSPIKVEPETVANSQATAVNLPMETSGSTASAGMSGGPASGSTACITSPAIEQAIPAGNSPSPVQVPLAELASSPSPESLPPLSEKPSSSASIAVEPQTPQPPVLRYANVNATHGVSSLEWMLARRTLPIASQADSRPLSRLSNEILTSSSPSHHDPAESSAPVPSVRAGGSDLQAADFSMESPQDSTSSADTSIRQSAPSRSLLDEMSRAEADDSMRSVVEVSSLDPRAAARAAAILKLNHAYIEHGRLPSSSSTVATPKRTPSKYRSDRFSSIATASKLSKPELLLEAELEIVEARRSRSRSVSVAPSLVSDSPYLPGGWIGTPAGVKRKRIYQEATPSVKGKEKMEDAAPWGVAEWKKLEKVYRSEREAWRKERQVKPLPTGGLLGWARRASGAHSAPKVEEWDGERVVERFLKEECKTAKGEWDRCLLSLRVNALTRRVEAKLAKESAADGDRSPKRPRQISSTAVERPAASGKLPGETTSIVPPSTIRRMIDYAFSFSTAKKAPARSTLSSSKSHTGATPGGLIDKLKAVREEPPAVAKDVPEVVTMRQAFTQPVTAAAKSLAARPVTGIPHPSSPSWESALSTDASFTTSGPSSRPISGLPTSRSTPDLSSLSFSFEGTPSRLYPSLNPPLSARSTALAKLFDQPPSSQSKSRIPVPIGVKKGSPKVADLVKSFEDSKVLGVTMPRPELPELRRVRSGR